MIVANIIRRLLLSLPDGDVPHPDLYRWVFILLGLFAVGIEIAIVTHARRVASTKLYIWAIRLTATGTGLIMLLLVEALYLQLGRPELSPLIYPAMIGEALLAVGLALLLSYYRRDRV